MLSRFAISVVQDHDANFVNARILWMLKLQLFVNCIFDCCTSAGYRFGIFWFDFKTYVGNVGLGEELATEN